MRVLAPLILVLPAAADVFAGDIRFLTANNSTSESVSSSTSTCIAGRPAMCGKEDPFVGNCGFFQKRTECWCGDICFAAYDYKCCDDDDGVIVATPIVVILIVAAIAAGIWCCCTQCTCYHDGEELNIAYKDRDLLPGQARRDLESEGATASATAVPFHRLKM